jgi:hypothetical protein
MRLLLEEAEAEEEAVVEVVEALVEAEELVEAVVVAVKVEVEEAVVFSLMIQTHVGNLDLELIPMMNGTTSPRSRNHEYLTFAMQQTLMILMLAV